MRDENGYDSFEHCVESAIDQCIEENVLRDFFIRRRKEVVDVITLNCTFERQLMLERQDGFEEGREEGLKRGRLATLITQICKKLKKNKSVEDIAEDLEEEIEEIAPICTFTEQFAPEYDSQQVLKRFMEVRAIK